MDTWSRGGLRKLLDYQDGLPEDEFCEPKCFKRSLFFLGLDVSDFPKERYGTNKYLQMLINKNIDFFIWISRDLKWSAWKIFLYLKFRSRFRSSVPSGHIRILYLLSKDVYPTESNFWWHAILIIKIEGLWLVFDPIACKETSLSGFYTDDECLVLISKASAIISIGK